jgi:hypothetical protein
MYYLFQFCTDEVSVCIDDAALLKIASAEATSVAPSMV